MDKKDGINQDQFFDLITGEDLSWQSIIYDLIRTEQLDPWNIDIGTLADRYVQTIRQLEEADFFISSKVLLACSILLRLKSELLITDYIRSLDEALYGKKEEKKYELERIEIDEGELPLLSPRTPLARHRKVTLRELMAALNKAVETENRRIKKEVRIKQAEKSVLTIMPKGSKIPLKVRVKRIFEILQGHIKNAKAPMRFSELAKDKEEKLASFVPILHLSNDKKIHLHQPIHFEEIHISLEQHPDEILALESELGLAGAEEEN